MAGLFWVFAYLKRTWFLTSNCILPCWLNVFLRILNVSLGLVHSMFVYAFVYDQFFWELSKIALLLVVWDFIISYSLVLGPWWTVDLFSRDCSWSGTLSWEILASYLTFILRLSVWFSWMVFLVPFCLNLGKRLHKFVLVLFFFNFQMLWLCSLGDVVSKVLNFSYHALFTCYPAPSLSMYWLGGGICWPGPSSKYFNGGLQILAFSSLRWFSKVNLFWRVGENVGTVLSRLTCSQVPLLVIYFRLWFSSLIIEFLLFSPSLPL